MDDRRVLSGIIFVNRNVLRWRNAPREYRPHKALYNRWKRWNEMGVFGRMKEGLASESADLKTVMIDAAYLKAHRTASSLREKGDPGRLIGRTRGSMNTKLHALADANGRPLSFFITAGQISDSTGAVALRDDLPKLRDELLNGEIFYTEGGANPDRELPSALHTLRPHSLLGYISPAHKPILLPPK